MHMVRSIVSGLSATWIDSNFTSMQVSWDQDSTANYRIWYSPVVDYEGRTCMLQSSTAVTTGSNIVLTELEPTLFYSISVETVCVAANTKLEGKFGLQACGCASICMYLRCLAGMCLKCSVMCVST